MTVSRNNDIVGYGLLAISIGAAASIAGNLFVQGEVLFVWARELLQPAFAAASLNGTVLLQALALLFGAALILQIRKRFGVTDWSGPAESMFALQYRAGPPLDTRIGTGSVLAAFVACGCGAPVGQYGPVIHLGATISQALRNRIRTPLRPDIMLACGMSAAITGAFNAPLAAMAFVFEVMLRRFKVSVIAAVAVATASAYSVDHALFDQSVFLPLTIDEPNIQHWGIAFTIAPLCALVAWFYIRSLQHTQRWTRGLPVGPGVKLGLCALICSLLGGLAPELLGLGRQPLQDMLSGSLGIGLLVVLLFGKILLTSACIASGFYGGIVATALIIGATAGALLAKGLMLIGIADWTPLLLLNAMAGVAAAVIGAPVTVTLLVIELTGSGVNGLLVVVTAYTSTWLTRTYLSPSYYQGQLDEILQSSRS